MSGARERWEQGYNLKTELLELNFGERIGGKVFFGDLVGMGYTGFEAVVGCDWVRCKGALVGAKNPKLSCRSSVLANETQRGHYSGRGDLVGVGYTRFEALGGRNWVRCEGVKIKS